VISATSAICSVKKGRTIVGIKAFALTTHLAVVANNDTDHPNVLVLGSGSLAGMPIHGVKALRELRDAIDFALAAAAEQE
jgi:hypothetical protein